MHICISDTMSNGQSVLPAVHPLHPWGWGEGFWGTLKQQRWRPDSDNNLCHLPSVMAGLMRSYEASLTLPPHPTMRTMFPSTHFTWGGGADRVRYVN
jgi:hypothetical protein